MVRVTTTIERLIAARSRYDDAEENQDLEVQLAALDVVLEYCYRLREFRRSTTCGSPAAYDSIVRAEPAGQVTEALVMIRGKLTHFLDTDIEPTRSHLYPGSNLFPGPNTFLGDILRWRNSAVVLCAHPDLLNHWAWNFYEAQAGQVSVTATLNDMHDFLLNDDLLALGSN